MSIVVVLLALTLQGLIPVHKPHLPILPTGPAPVLTPPRGRSH
jgi:hypothetical protein